MNRLVALCIAAMVIVLSACGGTSAPSTPAKPKYWAEFVKDILPDGKTFKPGEQVQNVWTVRNDGDVVWEGFTAEMVYGDYEKLPQEIQSIPVPITKPGQQVDIPISFAAPDKPGSYIAVYMLSTPGPDKTRVQFRKTLWVSFAVAI